MINMLLERVADSGARLARSRLPCSASSLVEKIRRREGFLCTAISSIGVDLFSGFYLVLNK